MPSCSWEPRRSVFQSGSPPSRAANHWLGGAPPCKRWSRGDARQSHTATWAAACGMPEPHAHVRARTTGTSGSVSRRRVRQRHAAGSDLAHAVARVRARELEASSFGRPAPTSTTHGYHGASVFPDRPAPSTARWVTQ